MMSPSKARRIEAHRATGSVEPVPGTVCVAIGHASRRDAVASDDRDQALRSLAASDEVVAYILHSEVQRGMRRAGAFSLPTWLEQRLEELDRNIERKHELGTALNSRLNSPTPDPYSGHITSKQAADLLGITKARVSQLIAAGTLTGERVGRNVLVRRSDVESHITTRSGESVGNHAAAPERAK